MRLSTLAVACICLVTFAAARWSSAAQSDTPLQLAVLPNVSARVILANYQPLRAMIERDVGRAVEVVTAPDFKNFQRRTQAGEYDIVVTAANLARMAQTEADYLPLGTFTPTLKGLLVMSRDRPVRTIEQLRGATLGMANPQSLIAMRGLGWLRERGLVAEFDFKTARAANEDSLAQMILRGETPLALLSSAEFRQIPAALRTRLDVFSEIVEVPGFVWLAHRRLGPALTGALRSRLKALDRSEEGRSFLSAAGVENWREIDGAELASLDGVVAETRRALGLDK